MPMENPISLPFLGGVWIKGLVVFFVSLVVVSTALDQVTVVYSPSDSLPYRTFLELKHIKPQLGQYAYFESPWYGGRVIKKIVGREGDKLSYDVQGNLWVGTQKIGKAKTQARDGRKLTPIKSGVIPQGMVFVEGEHERSFDSRYEELGLIPEAALGGRVLGLV
jgi:conjugal transfer pilin signal peptidase TrbI